MYQERREKASIKFYILIVLVILIIVFAIMLLIPKKKVVEKEPVEMELYSKSAMKDIKKNYSDIFYDNYKTLKDTAIKYFIKKVDGFSSKQKVSLDQIINDNHLMATLYDEEGNKCEEEKSYIAYTKNSNNDNYKMEIKLICGSEEETLTTYLGSYDYCEKADYCEKQVEVKPKAEDIEEPEEVEEQTETNTNEQTPPEPETPVENNDNVSSDYTLYEYVLSPSDSVGTYSDWSEWTTQKEEASLYKEIDTKAETKESQYDCSEHRTERYIASYKTEQYIAGYTIKTTKVGTKKDKGGVVAVYDTKKTPVYSTKKIPVYATRNINNNKVCTKTDTIEYYRYRIFSYNTGINYVRYSSSEDDQYLINQGYVKTGKTK